MIGTNHPHIIRHQYVEIQYNGQEAGGKVLQKRIVDLCLHRWQTCIERSLDEMELSDQYIVLDSLELDLGETNLDSLELHVMARIQEQLKVQLAQHTGHFHVTNSTQRSAGRTISSSIHAFEIFLFFLARGYLPWNAKLQPNQSLETWILSKWTLQEIPVSKWDELKSFLTQSQIRTRFENQFSRKFVKTILNEVIKSHYGSISIPVSLAHKWELVTSISTPIKKPERSLTSTKQKTETGQRIENEKQKTPFIPSWEGTGESVYIENSGLVILHPFLIRMFEGLHIAIDGKMQIPERGMAMLHYLATGQSLGGEINLVLPKILCGLPISEAVPLFELSEQDMEEAEALLRAVIGHWSALRNTTADGLRSTFLLRPGKLSETPDGDWLLEVETKSFDVLIGMMPWGFSRIQLPWMEKMLIVQWDYQQLM